MLKNLYRFNLEGMQELITKIKELEKDIGKIVQKRIMEFNEMKSKSNIDWFLELCFCILTANSSAKLGIRAQIEIGSGFLTLPQQELADKLKVLGHRFYRKRAEYIVEARKFRNIKDNVTSMRPKKARIWLKDNIKGIGMKEASHFMRNVGFLDFAILDRHVLDVLSRYGLITKPRHLSVAEYLRIEEKVLDLASKVGMKAGELDLYLWYLKTGEILK